MNKLTENLICTIGLLLIISSIIVIGAAQEDIVVDIDIKPGSLPNTINLGSNGNIPVAILSSSNFDATKVDPTTLTLAKAPVINNKQCKPMTSFEDVNKDGLMDLVVHFDTNYLQLKDTDTEAVLEGKTLDGKSIIGKDSVKVISSKKSKFQYSIDSCVKLTQTELIGLDHGPVRPVGAVINPDGKKDEFVANEVIFSPQKQGGLDTFVAKYGGTILREFTIPEENSKTWYLIRVNLGLSSLGDLASNAEAMGFIGQFKFSSDDAARLSALVVREVNNGATPNFLMQSQAILEHPDGFGGNLDAETWWWMTEDDDPITPGDQGVSVGIIRAWQYLRYMGIPPMEGSFSPVQIAIIDGGFALDETTGAPLNNNIDYQNSLNSPDQVDFVDLDRTAGGVNPGSCSGGTPCPWHGQGAFGIAAAYPRNLYGTAGTGAEIVTPYLLKVDDSVYMAGSGIYGATGHGAKVISMSFGGECNWWCRKFGNFDFSGFDQIKESLHYAAAVGSIPVAAAGNAGIDIKDKWYIPCVFYDVICVGSVNSNGNNVYNYDDGTSVDIWAPTGIYSTVTPDTVNNIGTNALYTFGGTSASTPYVAGIVSLMKALNPSLSLDQVRDILRSTSNPSSDPRVGTGIVDAYKAVNKVRPNQPPIVKITDPLDGASISYGGAHFSADISDPESPSIFGGTIRWSVVNYDFCTSTICPEVKFEDLFKNPIGQYTVYVRGIDQFDAMGTDSITVNVINSPPSIDIIKPLDGATFYSNQIIHFASSTSDVDQDPAQLIVSWSSNIDGSIDPITKLSIGIHTITATVTDELGLTTQDTITINVLSGEGYPTVAILNPPDLSNFFSGNLITFEGEAIDPEDGILGGSNLEWSSNKDGLLGTGNTIQKILSGSGSCEEGETKTHIVTLKTTDSDGHEVSDQITVYISSPC